MNHHVEHLDCCEDPSPLTLWTLNDGSHAAEALLRCSCGQHWFHRWFDRVESHGQRVGWTARVTEDEANDVLTALGNPPRAFLDGRACLRVQGGETTTDQGAPCLPWHHDPDLGVDMGLLHPDDP